MENFQMHMKVERTVLRMPLKPAPTRLLHMAYEAPHESPSHSLASFYSTHSPRWSLDSNHPGLISLFLICRLLPFQELNKMLFPKTRILWLSLSLFYSFTGLRGDVMSSGRPPLTSHPVSCPFLSFHLSQWQ